METKLSGAMSNNIQRRFDLTLLFVRIILGVIVMAHGVQKLFGWFNGYGYEGTMHFFTETIGLSYGVGLLIIVAETFGMIALILGLFGRLISVGLIIIMLGAIFTTHLQFGFFMNWDGSLPGEGYEFHILIIGLAVTIAANGTGAYSLDCFLLKKLRLKEKTTALT